VSVALVIRHEKGMRHIVISGPSSCTVFFYIFSQTVRLSKKVNEDKMCVLISLQLL